MWRTETGLLKTKRETEKTTRNLVDTNENRKEQDGGDLQEKAAQKGDSKSGIETGYGRTLEGEYTDAEKRLSEDQIIARPITSSRLTQPLEDQSTHLVNSGMDAGLNENNKYLLPDVDPMATAPTARKFVQGADAAGSSGPPSPDKLDPDDYKDLLKITHGSKEDLQVLTQDMAAKGLFGGAHMPTGVHQDFLTQQSDAMALVKQNNEHGDSFNEIIVKVEMRKFQNLINNRLQKRNNLVSSDINRVFPINILANGTA